MYIIKFKVNRLTVISYITIILVEITTRMQYVVYISGNTYCNKPSDVTVDSTSSMGVELVVRSVDRLLRVRLARNEHPCNNSLLGKQQNN